MLRKSKGDGGCQGVSPLVANGHKRKHIQFSTALLTFRKKCVVRPHRILVNTPRYLLNMIFVCVQLQCCSSALSPCSWLHFPCAFVLTAKQRLRVTSWRNQLCGPVPPTNTQRGLRTSCLVPDHGSFGRFLRAGERVCVGIYVRLHTEACVQHPLQYGREPQRIPEQLAVLF